MKHIMVDIETLGTGSQAPLFQIGYCTFNIKENTVDDPTVLHVDLLDVILQTGFAPELDTIAWWRRQEYDPAVRENYGLQEALDIFSSFMDTVDGFIWANSPSFDLVILEQHYIATGGVKPWSFRKEVDMRTIKWLHDELPYPQANFVEPSERHNAGADALAQAENVLSMYRSMELIL